MPSLPSEPNTLRPARAELARAVAAAREAHRRAPSSKRTATLAAGLAEAVGGVMLEEAAKLRLELAIGLERARTAAARLAALDVALGGLASPLIILAPLRGEPAKFITSPAGEIADAAERWRGFARRLAVDPLAEAAVHLKFDPPLGSSIGLSSGQSGGVKAAASVGTPAAADHIEARA